VVPYLHAAHDDPEFFCLFYLFGACIQQPAMLKQGTSKKNNFGNALLRKLPPIA